MSEQEPGPSQNPYGQPTNPYGQEPSSPNPYGQEPSSPNPYGQAYGEQQTPQPYGEPQQPYGAPAAPSGPGDSRPATVTAAAWITIVLSGLSAALFGFVALLFLIARDSIVAELERVEGFEQADLDPDSIVGVMVAFMLVLVIWAVISLLLGIFVLRRSNVARILLVISSAVVAAGSLLSITSGVAAIWLISAVAVIVMLFVGGAGDWFKRTPSYPGDAQGGYGYGYGDQQPGSPYDGQQGGSDYPPTDYPGR